MTPSFAVPIPSFPISRCGVVTVLSLATQSKYAMAGSWMEYPGSRLELLSFKCIFSIILLLLCCSAGLLLLLLFLIVRFWLLSTKFYPQNKLLLFFLDMSACSLFALNSFSLLSLWKSVFLYSCSVYEAVNFVVCTAGQNTVVPCVCS